jgi:DNA replication protein DnaC
MSTDLEPLLKRLSLANARRIWRDLVQRAEKEDWSYETLLFTLFSEEIAHRRGTRLTRALGAAAFPFLRTIEEYDFSYQSTLRLTTMGSLLSPDFVTEGRSVIFEGKPGRGKTHLAIAVAYRALQNGFDALFVTAAELIDHLSAASREGKLRDALAAYMRPHVLVVDEVGYLTYGNDAANVLYHVVNDRHIRRRAMIFTTNKHPRRWGPVLHDDDLADAIVDRILERGRLLRLDGPSVRTKHLPPDELAADPTDDPEDRRVSGKQDAEFPERTPATAPGLHGTSRTLSHIRGARRASSARRARLVSASSRGATDKWLLRTCDGRVASLIDDRKSVVASGRARAPACR